MKGVGWVQLAQDRDWRRALANTVKNLSGSGAADLVSSIDCFVRMHLLELNVCILCM